MAKSWPDTTPYEHPRLVAAYKDGWNHGHGIACHNVPEIGKTMFIDGEGRVTIDAENIREMHATICHLAADNARSYTPFEFTASAFNKMQDGGWFVLRDGDDPIGPFDSREAAEAEKGDDDNLDIEELPSAEEHWEAFEQGTGDAISADLAEYTDENYGIEDEDEDEDEDEAAEASE